MTDGTVVWTVLNVFVAVKDKAGNDLEAVVEKSLGVNGYVKYASGLIVQWGKSSTFSGDTIQFPVSFSIPPVVNVTYCDGVVGSTPAMVKDVTASSFAFTKETSIGFILWFAIGY